MRDSLVLKPPILNWFLPVEMSKHNQNAATSTSAVGSRESKLPWRTKRWEKDGWSCLFRSCCLAEMRKSTEKRLMWERWWSKKKNKAVHLSGGELGINRCEKANQTWPRLDWGGTGTLLGTDTVVAIQPAFWRRASAVMHNWKRQKRWREEARGGAQNWSAG